MDVYLVPASSTRYALYCEAASSTGEAADQSEPASWLDRMKASFRRAVDEGEEQQRGGADDLSRGRLRRFITRKIAEAVAEQRLLWNLRHETSATLVHPDLLDGAQAIAVTRAELESDYGRHRRWLVIDSLLVAVTGPALFFIPGPNVVSWYFTFRAVGHFFSMRGARRGLSAITWVSAPSAELSAVAEALREAPEARAARLADAAAALGLDRLAAFVERVADHTG